MIQGGEKYLYAAYAVAWGGMVVYLASLYWRLREAARNALPSTGNDNTEGNS